MTKEQKFILGIIVAVIIFIAFCVAAYFTMGWKGVGGVFVATAALMAITSGTKSENT